MLRQTPPTHRFSDWSKGRIDDFVAARLEEEGVEPSRQAHKARLLRRLSMDLTGLPPSQEWYSRREELSDAAVLGQYVDELLSSEGFGEHWARMWLDLMRFADDQAHIVGSNSSLFFPTPTGIATG